LPPNTGRIFNYDLFRRIYHRQSSWRRATCGDASKPMHHQGRVGDRRTKSTSCRGRYIGESPARGERFGQSRPAVSVLGGGQRRM